MIASVVVAVALASSFAGATPALTTADAELVSSIVAAEATRDERLDVLSSADVRNAVDLEAQRAVMGCDATSCLLEVAGAMDARLVIHGTMGTLGDVVVLTMNVFDTGAARALGRVVVQKKKVAELAEAIPPAVVELLALAPKPSPGTRVRTLVLDVKLAAAPASSAATAQPSNEPSTFPWLAAGALGVGVVGLGVGVTADVIAVSDASKITSSTSIEDAASIKTTRETTLLPAALIGYGVAVVGVGVGVTLFALGGET